MGFSNQNIDFLPGMPGGVPIRGGTTQANFHFWRQGGSHDTTPNTLDPPPGEVLGAMLFAAIPCFEVRTTKDPPHLIIKIKMRRGTATIRRQCGQTGGNARDLSAAPRAANCGVTLVWRGEWGTVRVGERGQAEWGQESVVA